MSRRRAVGDGIAHPFTGLTGLSPILSHASVGCRVVRLPTVLPSRSQKSRSRVARPAIFTLANDFHLRILSTGSGRSIETGTSLARAFPISRAAASASQRRHGEPGVTRSKRKRWRGDRLFLQCPQRSRHQGRPRQWGLRRHAGGLRLPRLPPPVRALRPDRQTDHPRKRCARLRRMWSRHRRVGGGRTRVRRVGGRRGGVSAATRLT